MRNSLFFMIFLLMSGCRSDVKNQRISVKETTKSPNVIFVLADDLGIGRFKLALEELDKGLMDPNIKKRDELKYSTTKIIRDSKKSIETLTQLAEEGTYFTNAFATSPWCCPSRLSILTGQYPQKNKVWISNDIVGGEVTSQVPFLSELLAGADYRTALIGKWHLGNNARSGGISGLQHPNEKGFEYFMGFDGPGTRGYNSEILMRNRAATEAEGFLVDQFTNEAINFIESNVEEKFFMFLSYTPPHGPLFLAPEHYYKIFDKNNSYEKNDQVTRDVLDINGATLADNYNAHIYAMDQGIKKIINTLQQKRILDNTIIVFTSDHGASGFETTPLPANSPYLGYKGQYHDGSLRVPLLFWNPNYIKAGKVSEQLTMGFDLLPTILDLLDITIPESRSTDGKSLRPILQNGEDNPIHEHLVWAGLHTEFQGFDYAERRGEDMIGTWVIKDKNNTLRYVHNQEIGLFDCDDYNEANNLATDNLELVTSLTGKYANWFESVLPPLFFKYTHDQVNPERLMEAK